MEKADRDAIQNIILPLMGEGIVTDKNNGNPLYATDFIVIYTSNIVIRPETLQAMGFRDGSAEVTESAIFDALSATHIIPKGIIRKMPF